MNRFTKYALIWLALVPITAIVISNLDTLNWWTCLELERHGGSTQGAVMEFLPKFHNMLRYEYHVAGRVYGGHSVPDAPNPTLSQVSIGDSLVVYYDPKRPEISIIEYPENRLRDETINVCIVAVIFPTAFVVRLFFYNRRRQRTK